ncbi:MAG: hypothetical protein ACHQ53_05885 [Polyangiales bacterium]
MTEPESSSSNTSLRPVETDASLFKEADSLQKGSGLKLIGFVVGALAVIGLGIAVVGNLDSRQGFVDAGARVAALNETGFEAFWNCALVNMNQTQLKSSEDLEFQLEKRAQHFGHPYVATLTRCGASLDTLERDLTTLSVPAPLQPQLQALAKAAGDLRHALQDYAATASPAGAPYDPNAGKPALTKLSQTWQAFKQSNSAFTEALRKHI